MAIKNLKFYSFTGSCKRAREGATETDRLGGPAQINKGFSAERMTNQCSEG